jgi:hypothetical protein
MYELSVSLIDPTVAPGEDQTVFWCELQVCEECLDVVKGILAERVILKDTPKDVFGEEETVVHAAHDLSGSVAALSSLSVDETIEEV